MDESHKCNLSEKSPRQKYKTICFYLYEEQKQVKATNAVVVKIVKVMVIPESR